MMKVKYYKCPICNRKFKTLNGWGSHMTSEHPEFIPEGYSISRYFYFTVTGKTHGVCRTCKANTEWNENTMKYDQYCKDPKCKEAYAKIAKQRMIGKYGKVHLLNDPNHQKKMLENRKISGKYKFQDGIEFGYVGSYEREFLKMLDTMMQWHSNDLMSPSPHTYYYEYRNEKDIEANWGTKFYIPDFYIPSLNLEIEIKQTTSTNQEFLDIVREKEYLKDEVMKTNKDVNYLKITDNNFAPFFEFLLKAKENIPTEEEERKNIVGAVVESYIPKEMHDGFRVSYNVPHIKKQWGVYDKDGLYNACVKVSNFDKPLRGRSEILIINDDKVFLSFREDGTYQIPGGGWDKVESRKQTAIREAREEVRINVKDVEYISTYMTYADKPKYWVTRKIISKKDWWYGGYTELFIGNYDSKYEGHIDYMDKDTMIHTGKFYKIDDVYDKLIYAHRNAIDVYRAKHETVATEALGVVEAVQLISLGLTVGKVVGNLWKDKLFKSKAASAEKKSILPQAMKVSLINGYIEIRGINYQLLMERVKQFYVDKSINNIFNPVYNTLSYKKYEKKQIQKKDIKIDYIQTPEFFALELTKLFVELGERYKDKIYLRVAHKIYEESWLAKADANTENTDLLDTSNLSNLTLTLNNYQKEFIEKYPKLKAQLNLNGYILAFEQGLGKTLTAIGLSECLDVDHVYIVCPNSLKENWALEIKKYYEKYSDDALWDKEVLICNGKFGTFNKETTKFFIVNNESIEKMFPYVLSGRNMLILDESHNFRNANAKRTQNLLELRDKLKCVDTLIMSGTPIKATPSEIVPALLMIDPLFTVEAATIFTKAFKLKETLGSSLVQNRFGKVIYRKEKDVLENKLPEKHVMTVPVTITDGSKYTLSKVNELISKRYEEIYKDGEAEMLQMRGPFFKFANAYNPPSPEDKTRFDDLVDYCIRPDSESLDELDRDFINAYIMSIKGTIKKHDDLKYFDFLVRNYLRYKQHCLGLAMGEILPKYRSQMFIDMYDQNRETFLSEIKTSTKKTLIFSQFKNVVNYIHNDLNDHGIGAVMISGDVKDRLSILREFKENDNIRVLVATSQTIGTGVTLVEANQMYFFGPPWRDADFAQCSDRIHRIGQTEDVFIKTITLNTGNAFNLSSRMDTILAWSKKMTSSVIITTDDATDIDNTNFEDMLASMESTLTFDSYDSEIVNVLFAMEAEDEENIINDFEIDYKKIPKNLLKNMIKYESGFRYCKAIATAIIPKNCILEECSVSSPTVNGRFKDLKFTELGSAVFGQICQTKKAPVRFEQVIDDDHEYWNIITNIDIKPGTVLSYDAQDQFPSFANEDRM